MWVPHGLLFDEASGVYEQMEHAVMSGLNNSDNFGELSHLRPNVVAGYAGFDDTLGPRWRPYWGVWTADEEGESAFSREVMPIL